MQRTGCEWSWAVSAVPPALQPTGDMSPHAYLHIHGPGAFAEVFVVPFL